MRIGICAAVTIALALAGAGCRTPAGPALTFTLDANPSPILGQPCLGCGAGSTDREAATTLTLRELSGGAGTVTTILMVLRVGGSGAVIAQGEFGTAAVAQLAGSSRLTANGSLTVPCGVHYPASEQGRPAVLTLTVHVTDDRGPTVMRELAVVVTLT